MLFEHRPDPRGEQRHWNAAENVSDWLDLRLGLSNVRNRDITYVPRLRVPSGCGRNHPKTSSSKDPRQPDSHR